MKRRLFLSGAVSAIIAVTLPAKATPSTWANGHLERGTFIWSNGGGDPYTGSLDQALRLVGIADARVRALIVSKVRQSPNGNAPRYTIQDGDRLGVMVSGNGWVARDPIAQVSTWRQGRSRRASVWYVTDPVTKAQYRLIRADVCGNWLFEFYGAPEVCRCIKGVDAC